MCLYRGAVALILFATALLKFIAVARHERLLQAPDPLLGVGLAYVAVAAGLLELALAAFVLGSNRPKAVLVTTHSFSTMLLLYRFAAVTTGQTPCPCLGGGVAWWPWLDQNQTSVTLGVALWLWLTSLVLLKSYADQQRKSDEHLLGGVAASFHNELKG